MITVLFTKLQEDAIVPTMAYPSEDAGWDLYAVEDTEVVRWTSSDKLPLTWIKTGIAVAIPTGYYGRVVGRSSAASKGLHVIEGVVDSGYRGELLLRVCPLWREERSHEQFLPGKLNHRVVDAGESLAQLIVTPVIEVSMREVEQLPPSERGHNGWGSSG